MPGSRPSLRQMRSSFARWASTERHLGREVESARVRHGLVEDELVEVVREVVVVGDGGPVALTGVQVAGELRLGLGDLGPPSEGAGAAAPRAAARAMVRRRIRGFAASGSAARASRTADHMARRPWARSPSMSRWPFTYARATPSSPGDHMMWRSAFLSLMSSTGAPSTPASLPSHARRRIGSLMFRASSARERRRAAVFMAPIELCVQGFRHLKILRRVGQAGMLRA